jgi:hypothetical protein
VAPVSATNVHIWLSTDDGRNWTEPLATSTPNDGSEMITVPGTITTEARVIVEADGNVFFDMNDDTFAVEGGTGVEPLLAADGAALEVSPNPFTNRTNVAFSLARSGPVEIGIYDAAGRRVTTLLDGVRAAGTHRTEWNGRDAGGAAAASGVYFVRLVSEGRTQTTRVIHLD